jgi:ubiquinone biosynthesis protein UbiJ
VPATAITIPKEDNDPVAVLAGVAATRQRPAATTKSERAEADCAAPMGRGATATEERVLASLGLINECAPQFTASIDVPNGGVLLALPALLVTGLLHRVEKFFRLPSGFYGLQTILLLLAFMALARLRSIESLRYLSPGEFGKVLGMDRAPEVRTLRMKLKHLARLEQAFEWSAELAKEWMMMVPEEAAVLYADCHVRVYHGKKQLPKHYVARQRLCLAASADYWVNAMDGKPFFVVNQPVDPGLLQTLEHEIVPRLEQDVPNQPGAEELEADLRLHRFTIVFDREGYSPDFFARMKARRLACLSYRKRPGEDWPREEFIPTEIRLPAGERTTILLAERGTKLSNGLWVRELRKLSGGHETSFIATDYRSAASCLASRMFARWSQENFFRYMRQNYNLDGLVDYGTGVIPETTQVVNPAHRRLDGMVRRKASLLNRKQAEFGAINLEDDIEPKKVEAFAQRKSELQDAVAELQKEIDDLKAQRKATNRHITYQELPEESRIERLSTQSKHLIDTIKMIAYRAETAMAQIVREKMTRHDDARSLLRAIYQTEADLVPDQQAKTLTVHLHPLANASSDEAVRHLCSEINATETTFPGTDLRIIYELVSPQIP